MNTSEKIIAVSNLICSECSIASICDECKKPHLRLKNCVIMNLLKEIYDSVGGFYHDGPLI